MTANASAFQKALEREIALHEIAVRTIGTWHNPYPGLPTPATSEQKAEVHAEYERLVRELEGNDPL